MSIPRLEYCLDAYSWVWSVHPRGQEIASLEKDFVKKLRKVHAHRGCRSGTPESLSLDLGATFAFCMFCVFCVEQPQNEVSGTALHLWWLLYPEVQGLLLSSHTALIKSRTLKLRAALQPNFKLCQGPNTNRWQSPCCSSFTGVSCCISSVSFNLEQLLSLSPSQLEEFEAGLFSLFPRASVQVLHLGIGSQSWYITAEAHEHTVGCVNFIWLMCCLPGFFLELLYFLL